MPHLILVRHGTSEWNKINKWTGLTDVDLAEEGKEEARKMGELIKDFDIKTVFTSALKRTHQTFDEIKKALSKEFTPIRHPSLNERDYGDYTGNDKWQMKELVGDEQFQAIRRGWDAEVPGGENLKDVHARVIPYYEEHIRPRLKDGNVLVVAHGNSLRALVKHLDQMSDKEVEKLEIGFGEISCYEMDEGGFVCGKEIRNVNT